MSDVDNGGTDSGGEGEGVTTPETESVPDGGTTDGGEATQPDAE